MKTKAALEYYMYAEYTRSTAGVQNHAALLNPPPQVQEIPQQVPAH